MNVLFLIFNRPELTRRVFERIRQARPDRLFVAADGPRPGREGDAALCAEARTIVKQVDWPCLLHTLFRESNLGCCNAVSSAITWFFEHVEEGVILEDDCLPDPSFFSFCQGLLERYRHDERIMHIGGNTFVGRRKRFHASYYFSKYSHNWGWATWRRAWRQFDVTMQTWPAFRDKGGINVACPTLDERRYWTEWFDHVHSGKISSVWDAQWLYTCWSRQGLSILPSVNLVTNIGGGGEATHTKEQAWYLNLPAGCIGVMRHPAAVKQDQRADAITFDHFFRVGQTSALRRMLTRLTSRWTYGALIRRLPVAGRLWAMWRTGLSRRRACSK